MTAVLPGWLLRARMLFASLLAVSPPGGGLPPPQPPSGGVPPLPPPPPPPPPGGGAPPYGGGYAPYRGGGSGEHSRVGMASFYAAIAAWVCFALMWLVSAVFAHTGTANPIEAMQSAGGLVAIVVVLFALAVLGSLAGMVLGIVCLATSDGTSKLFGIIGLVLSVLPILGMLGCCACGGCVAGLVAGASDEVLGGL